MALRDHRTWNREWELGLPDSRLSGATRDRKRSFFRGQWWERVYCANCGADGGLVTADWSPHLFYVCQECVNISGPPPGCKEAPVPDEARRK